METEEDLLDALIALGSNCDSIGTIDAVKIDEQYIINLSIEEEDGNTPTIGINKKHRNITNLNFVSLGDLITSMIYGLKGGYIRRTKGQMKTILAKAYLNSKLDFKKMKPSIQAEIQNAVKNKINHSSIDSIV